MAQERLSLVDGILACLGVNRLDSALKQSNIFMVNTRGRQSDFDFPFFRMFGY
jgi:hypothetical protein